MVGKPLTSLYRLQKILQWLDQCDKLNYLNFSPMDAVQRAIDYTQDIGYLPRGEIKLKEQAPDLYIRLSRDREKRISEIWRGN